MLIKIILYLVALALVMAFPPLGFAIAFGGVAMVLWNDWKRDNSL